MWIEGKMNASYLPNDNGKTGFIYMSKNKIILYVRTII